MLLVEVFAGGRLVRTHGTALTEDLERLLAELLAADPAAPVAAPPPRLVLAVAAGLVRVATTTSLTGRTGELPELADPLAAWVVAVYGERAIALCTPARASGAGRREPIPFPDESSGPDARAMGHGERERLLSAAVRLAVRDGLEGLTASRIRRDAGVPRRSFDARFGGATECFLAAAESLAREGAARAGAWAAQADGPEQRAYRTVLALAAQAARNPDLARLVLADLPGAGRDGLLRRERLLTDAATALRGLMPPRPRTGLGAEASVAAAWRTAEAETLDGDNEHPTQAVIDLYAIERFLGPPAELRIAICGDLGQRTARSLIRLLERTPPRSLRLIAPPGRDDPGVPLSAPLSGRLRNRADLDLLYMAGLPPGGDKGRLSAAAREPYVLTAQRLGTLPADAIVLSPLPMVDEISPEARTDPRVRCFAQSDKGLFVRMAVLEPMLASLA